MYKKRSEKSTPAQPEKNGLFKRIQGNDKLLLFLIAVPGLLHFFVFKYIPIAGNVIAFQDYNIFAGISNSRWVGFEHFVTMFERDNFYQILRNTVFLGFLNILFAFPAPLILALLLNEVRKMWFKRWSQTLLYLPHFLSWVIVGGLFINLLAPDGLINMFLGLFGMEPIDFVTNKSTYYGVIVGTAVWKGVGWGTIIYLAALSGINPNLYDAAKVDGAGRWRQMWHITLPALTPAIVILFLLQIGDFLENNVEQMLVFLNPLVLDVGEVFDTYIYRVGLTASQFSYTTAIGIFKSVVGILLIVGLNKLAKRMTGESIY
jgi:putative aldouronate transport system permease protein